MRDNRTAEHYHVIAKVLASTKEMSYNVEVTLSVNSCFVVDASCHCKSSVVGRCSRNIAFLMLLLYE